jgi:dihydrolipoamide dehydrogenase
MTYDVIVLGSGPAGYYFSKRAAFHGKKVLVIEKEFIGGTGFRTGCLPVKKYMDGLRQARALEKASQMPWATGSVDYKALYNTCFEQVPHVEDLMRSQLRACGVDIVMGTPEVLSASQVQVGDKVYETSKIVVATGTTTNTLLDCPIDETQVLTHKGAVAMTTLPDSMLIIGGNVEGIEFASYLSGFGVKVTIIAMGPELIEGTDRDLCAETLAYIEENGGVCHLNTMVTGIEVQSDAVKVTTEKGQSLVADKLLITGARSGNIPMGILEGATIDNTCLKVDEHYQTSIENIYAIGDVNGLHGMAHIAIQQGLQLADYLYGNGTCQRDYESLPRSIFTINEIAGAGLQECNCKDAGIDYQVSTVELKDTMRAWSKDIDFGKVKIITDNEKKIIGAWMSGENASDYMGTVGLWIDRQVTVEEMMNTLFIHPSCWLRD